MPDFVAPTDPDNIPVRVINGLSVATVMGGLIHITLITTRIAAGPDGKLEHDNVIAARLRFDLDMARAVRSALDIQIALLAPPDTKAN